MPPISTRYPYVRPTWGTARGNTRTLAALGYGWEATHVPVLSLSAEGALALKRATLPVGQTVTALGEGPGAPVILHTPALARAAGAEEGTTGTSSASGP